MHVRDGVGGALTVSSVTTTLPFGRSLGAISFAACLTCAGIVSAEATGMSMHAALAKGYANLMQAQGQPPHTRRTCCITAYGCDEHACGDSRNSQTPSEAKIKNWSDTSKARAEICNGVLMQSAKRAQSVQVGYGHRSISVTLATLRIRVKCVLRIRARLGRPGQASHLWFRCDSNHCANGITNGARHC